MELSQAKLEEMVVGKPIDPTIRFYEKAVINVEASKEAGRRVYENILMIERRVPGVTDYVPQRAKSRDIARWPAEYAAYQRTVQRQKSPSVSVIPGISNIEAQELIDRGYSTVERLATATDVPGHLVHLQPKAQRIHQVIQTEEIERGNEEESQQEDRVEETRKAEDVPASGRPEHRHHVGQPEAGRVQGPSREAGEGLRPSRREHGRQDWGKIRYV